MTLLMIITIAMTAFADNGDEKSLININSENGITNIEKITEMVDFDCISNEDIQNTPIEPIIFSLNPAPKVAHYNYMLEPAPGDLDFLKDIMPVVNQLSIVNNKFGVGLGIKIY